MSRHDEAAADTAAWEIEVERFAAGEMPRAEENRFLARCESEPEHWRSVALACVEHRRLTTILRAERSLACYGSSTMSAGETNQRATSRQLLAVAAALALLACGSAIGYRFGVARGPVTKAMGVAAPQRTAPIDGDVATQLAALAKPLLPQAAAQVLRDAGIDVSEEPVVYLVQGSNGERWAMPETQLQLRLPGTGRQKP